MFHRVGHTTVNLDSLTGELQARVHTYPFKLFQADELHIPWLQVPVDMPDLQLLPMKLAVNDSRAPAPRAQGKVEAAQRHGRHRVG